MSHVYRGNACIHHYLTECKTVEQPPGFADFLRGTLALYKLSKQYKYRFELERTHPVFSYLKTSDPVKESTESLIEMESLTDKPLMETFE